MKKVFLLFLFLIAIPVLLLAAEPERVWTLQDGRAAKAAFDIENDTDPKIVLLIRKGNVYKILFNKLSKADQDYVTKVRAARKQEEEEVGLEEVTDDEDEEDVGLEEVTDDEDEEDVGLEEVTDDEDEEDVGLEEVTDDEDEEDVGLEEVTDDEDEEDVGLGEVTDDKNNVDLNKTKPGDRKVIKVNDVEFAFRYCPPGKFTMGSPESEEGRNDDETQYEISMNEFWILETEITQQQWNAIMGKNSDQNMDERPVLSVSWDDCLDFCKKCTELGMPVQLPTEMQWEYACRAGTKGAYAGDLDEMAWYNNPRPVFTNPGPLVNRIRNGLGIRRPSSQTVGQKMPNAWGLYDMYGNADEFCLESSNYGGNPMDPTEQNVREHVCRGGNFFSPANDCRSASRRKTASAGFRVVLSTSSPK